MAQPFETSSVEAIAGPSAQTMISEASLKLATPILVRSALALFGWAWSPTTLDDDDQGMSGEPGLYAWVIPTRGALLPELLGSPAIYWGKGSSVRGVADRLRSEMSWSRGRPIVGHGLAVARTGAVPVVGPLAPDGADRELWRVLEESIPKCVRDVAVDKLGAFAELMHSPDIALASAERFAIRAAVYAGDVPPPVNSQFAGAWEFKEGKTDLADVAAWYAVKHLTGGIRGWDEA